MRVKCYICGQSYDKSVMPKLEGKGTVQEIAIFRRSSTDRNPEQVNTKTRICFSCHMSIKNEIQLLQQDPQCTRLNVMSCYKSCPICRSASETTVLRRLSVSCRVDIFVKLNIFIPQHARCCPDHLNDDDKIREEYYGHILYINRPYLLKGKDLETFLYGLRLAALENTGFI